MKDIKIKNIIIGGCAILCAVVCLNGCERKDIAENRFPKKTFPITEQKTHSPNFESDYESMICFADAVVLGEITKESRSEYTNPSLNKAKNASKLWQTKYTMRVDKSYKGVITEDEIEVVTLNKTKPSKIRKTYASEDDAPEFYLSKGQRGIFMLKYNNEDGLYDVAYEDEGVFKLKDPDAVMSSENLNQVYASPSFEITLGNLTDDVKRVNEICDAYDRAAEQTAEQRKNNIETAK